MEYLDNSIILFIVKANIVNYNINFKSLENTKKISLLSREGNKDSDFILVIDSLISNIL